MANWRTPNPHSGVRFTHRLPKRKESMVKVEETLLKRYSDKELVKYIREELERALNATVSEDCSTEAKLALRLSAAGKLLPLLRAVDKRMNGSSTGNNVVI